MALTDDIARIAAIQVSLHVRDGQAEVLRQQARLSVEEIAKAAGTTPDTVRLWERGRVRPTTAQALAWLDLLHDRLRFNLGPGRGEDRG